MLLDVLSFGDLVAFVFGSRVLLAARGRPEVGRRTRNLLLAWIGLTAVLPWVFLDAPLQVRAIQWIVSTVTGLLLIRLGAVTFSALLRTDHLEMGEAPTEPGVGEAHTGP